MRQLHPDVAENDDGDLFLTRGRHNVFAHALGRRHLPDDALPCFRDNLQKRLEHTTRSGAFYRHVILPDKQTVLRHRLPDLDIRGLGEPFADACGSDLLYLASELQERAHHDQVFLRTDTHMTALGEIFASVAIVDEVESGLGSGQVDRLRALLTREVDHVGDLGGKLDPVRGERRSLLRPDWPSSRFTNGLAAAGNDGIIDIFISPSAVSSRRLVAFGDSFLRGCLLPLSLFFREILFIRTRFYHPEVVDLVRPDVVLTQNVERYLANVKPDRLRPHALLYPALAGREQKATPGFAAMLDAMLAHTFDPDRLGRSLAADRDQSSGGR